MSWKYIFDFRHPVMIEHSKICYPPGPKKQKLVDQVDTSYPGIVIQYDNGYYQIEDGVHRITKFQQQGIFKSLFYVVTQQEYKDGIVGMNFVGLDGRRYWTKLGEWNHNTIDPQSHNK